MEQKVIPLSWGYVRLMCYDVCFFTGWHADDHGKNTAAYRLRRNITLNRIIYRFMQIRDSNLCIGDGVWVMDTNSLCKNIELEFVPRDDESQSYRKTSNRHIVSSHRNGRTSSITTSRPILRPFSTINCSFTTMKSLLECDNLKPQKA